MVIVDNLYLLVAVPVLRKRRLSLLNPFLLKKAGNISCANSKIVPGGGDQRGLQDQQQECCADQQGEGDDHNRAYGRALADSPPALAAPGGLPPADDGRLGTDGVRDHPGSVIRTT